MRTIVEFFKDERGLELPEYAVNAAIIIGVTVIAIGLVAAAIVNRFTSLATTIDTGGAGQ